MQKVLRILAGVFAFVLIGTYIIASIIANNWFNSIGVIFIAILFGMYALRGNNWPRYLSWFRNVNKKKDGNDYYGSVDFGWFKNLFKKNKK